MIIQRIRTQISDTFSRAGFELTQQQIETFQAYESELVAWNARAGLISPGDESRIVERHFLESAALSRLAVFSANASVLDLGSGGGFPGLPLKIMRPDLKVTLLEATRKKATFLTHALQKMALEAVVINDRAETAIQNEQLLGAFDIVVARAVSELVKLIKWARPFLMNKGSLLTIKGSNITNELAVLKKRLPDAKADIQPFPGEWPGCEKLKIVEITL